MKLKDCKNWKAVRLDDRTILKDDLKLMGADQRKAFDNLDVIPWAGRKDYYIVEMTHLKLIRTAVGMSQSKLAEVSGINIRMIQHYEQGVKDINAAAALTVYRLAQALECTVGELLEIQEEDTLTPKGEGNS